MFAGDYLLFNLDGLVQSDLSGIYHFRNSALKELLTLAILNTICINKYTYFGNHIFAFFDHLFDDRIGVNQCVHDRHLPGVSMEIRNSTEACGKTRGLEPHQLNN